MTGGTGTGDAAQTTRSPGRTGSAAASAGHLPDVLAGLSRHEALYRRLVLICDEVGDAALRGADPAELTCVFARLVGKTVILLDPSFRVMAHADANGAEPDPGTLFHPADDGAARLLGALARAGRTLRVPALPGSGWDRSCVATPITVGDMTLGYLLVADTADADGTDDVDLLITTYAATLFALTLAHQRTSVDLGQRYRAAVLDALVSGGFLDAHDAERKAAILGLAATQPYRVGVIGAVSAEEHRRRLALTSDMATELIGLISARVSGPIAAVRDSELVMLLPEDTEEEARTSAATALEVVTGLLSRHFVAVQLTCGVSERLHRPEAAPHGLAQAAQAIDLGVRIGRGGGVVVYDDLGVYRLLLRIGDMRELWDFAEDVLGELIAYEATRSLDLIGTLSAYLSEHCSLKQAARRLRVHPNTVAYRVHRIEELTHLRLGDPEDRLSAHIAVKIIESQRATGHLPPDGA